MGGATILFLLSFHSKHYFFFIFFLSLVRLPLTVTDWGLKSKSLQGPWLLYDGEKAYKSAFDGDASP